MTEEIDARASRQPILGSNWKKGGAIVFLLAIFWFSPSFYRAYALSCRFGIAAAVVDTSKENRQQTNGVWVIDVVEISALEATDKSVACAGTAILSDASRRPISFRTYEDYGKWWTEYQTR